MLPIIAAAAGGYVVFRGAEALGKKAYQHWYGEVNTKAKAKAKTNREKPAPKNVRTTASKELVEEISAIYDSVAQELGLTPEVAEAKKKAAVTQVCADARRAGRQNKKSASAAGKPPFADQLREAIEKNGLSVIA